MHIYLIQYHICYVLYIYIYSIGFICILLIDDDWISIPSYEFCVFVHVCACDLFIFFTSFTFLALKCSQYFLNILKHFASVDQELKMLFFIPICKLY